MNPLQPASMFFMRGNPGLLNDVEMLQTDVMRFFAILCLCLTAIFALVKALPMAPSEEPTIAEATSLKVEAEALQKQIAELKERLAETQTRVQTATAAADQASARAAKDELEALARVADVRQELENLLQSLNDTRRKIEMREAELVQIAKNIDDKQQLRTELKAQIDKEDKNLAEIRAALERSRAEPAQSPEKNQAAKDKPPEAMPQPEPARKGFSLRFASDAALETLITDGQVRFYAIAGMKAWQLDLRGGRPVYIPSKLPKEIYEMETLTVPTAYTSAFHRQVAAFGRRKVTWGVTLPSKISSSIDQLTKSRQGGDLVIMSDGAVTWK